MARQQQQSPPNQQQQPGNQSKKTELQARLEDFERELVSPKISSQLAAVLPNKQSVSQEIEMIKSTMRRAATENPTRNPLLCTRQSLYAAVVQVFELGLQPLPALGHVHFIPFENHGKLICQLIIGYRGYIELSRRSGITSGMTSDVVYENDYFRFERGDTPIMKHVPYYAVRFSPEAREAFAGKLPTESGKLVAAYCSVQMKDGFKQSEVVAEDYIKKVRAVSRAKREDSPWNQWPDQMWKKTAIRYTLKYVPLSPEDRLFRAIEVDERAFLDFGRTVETTGTEVPSNSKKPRSASRTPEVQTADPETGEMPLDDEGSESQEQSGMDQYSNAHSSDESSNPEASAGAPNDTTSSAPSASAENDEGKQNAGGQETPSSDKDGANPPEDAPRGRRRPRRSSS